jgi:hypothetical protein
MENRPANRIVVVAFKENGGGSLRALDDNDTHILLSGI